MGQKGLVTAQKYAWEGIASRVLTYYSKTIETARQQGIVK